MKCSLCISNFLEEIFSLSYSIVFLYFFALITEEGWVVQICWHIECSTFTASPLRIWNSSTGIPSSPLALFIKILPKVHLTSTPFYFHWFLKCRCSLLPSPVWPLPICLDSWTSHSRFLCNIALYSIRLLPSPVTSTAGCCFCFGSVPLIQFSVDGWGYVLSLLFDLRSNYGGGNEDNGDFLKKVPSRHCCTQCRQPCSGPPPTYSSDPVHCWPGLLRRHSNSVLSRSVWGIPNPNPNPNPKP